MIKMYFNTLTTEIIDSFDIFAGTSEFCNVPESLLGCQLYMLLLLYSMDSKVINKGMS